MDQEFFRVPSARIAHDRWPSTESVLRYEDVPASDTWPPQGDMSLGPCACVQDGPPLGQEHTQLVWEKRSSGRPDVLVVDEDEAIRSMLEWGLERKGFTVWSAENGPHACRLYRDHCADIDVVLLEVSRLSWDGVSTFFALREFNPDVRICLMSSDLGPYTKAELFQLGAAAFIRKPFQLDQVVRLLWALVDSSARTSL
jgi:CheY-like chemotaxis protein